MAKRKIATMEELSTATGVSRPTLSKYFHNADSVRASSRVRIEEALKVYDYRPNIFAINQNRRNTKTIGIMVPYLADPFFAEIVRNIERLCISAGYWPILFSAHGELALENDALATLGSLRPAGALIAPLGEKSDFEVIRRFTEDVPTVVFDSSLAVGEAFVGHDNLQATRLLADHLCRTGTPPCFLEMPPVNPNALKRRRAFTTAMEELGHEPRILMVGDESWDFERIGLEEGRRLIDEGTLPSSTIMCSNDRLAIGFLAAAYERGLRVGTGHGCALRVAGHDDHPFSRFTCPALTTVAQDYAGIATRSAETLFALIDTGARSGNGQSQSSTLLPGHLVLRQSA
ncbi:LacI family transcriptional regulator [Rhizobiaceae bacterium]|nr:LacI family transcriptional regulator [Rhizobiaceae bacterium]